MNHFNVSQEDAVSGESSWTLSAWKGFTLLVNNLHVLDNQASLPALVLTDPTLERGLSLDVNYLVR